MSDDSIANEDQFGLSRRRFLGVAAGTAAAGALAGPVLWQQPARAGAAVPEQLHLQFGSDASTQMTVSWATSTAVANPMLRLGTPAGGYGSTVPAITRTYLDHATGIEVFTHHVPLDKLHPATEYVYEVLHDGAEPVTGTFETGPRGRAPFRFTSFGDQGTGDTTYTVSGPFGAYVVDQVEAKKPLLHLLNGDLAYGNLQHNPAAAWNAFFNNNMRSARNRPWMPAAGNHENELGNGPQGFASYLTRFWLPDNGIPEFSGNWYAFTAGSVRFVVLQNDDVCFQDAGNFYIRGYSAGAQQRWLEATLAQARADRGIDWIVVCMHQLLLSSSTGNGSDLGIREEFGPLFDRYGVDLVLAGHDHDYERTHPVRGVDADSPTLRPSVVATGTDVVDTSKGTVHMVLGGGGTDIPTNTYGGGVDGAPPVAKVITGRTATSVQPEVATWSAVRDPSWPFGFALIDVDPGSEPGGTTALHVTYFHTSPGSGSQPQPFESFTLTRPRNDG
ncbi:metallophosphoesterase family protein [Saccharopolyspora sp. WRP15-2]|uniref:Metallophosphoesterase family protein n=1 Tax=Saccharopolyspora oryzae TaxID=2997343 RepID=A0ABT4UX56_9PSEU|nr:metallophosphoesterase family protein [Saccharopolyspora oryzae]MDA3625719.1 metallophosphoesterase family protein [Saccharopolyspora oryzae]